MSASMACWSSARGTTSTGRRPTAFATQFGKKADQGGVDPAGRDPVDRAPTRLPPCDREWRPVQVFCASNGADVVFHPVGHVADSHAQGVKFPAGRQGGAGRGAAAVEVGSGVFHYPCHVAYSLVQTAQYGPAEQPGRDRGQRRSPCPGAGPGRPARARNAREGRMASPDDSGRTTRRGLNLGGGVDEVQVECGAAPYGTAPAVVQRAGYFRGGRRARAVRPPDRRRCPYRPVPGPSRSQKSTECPCARAKSSRKAGRAAVSRSGRASSRAAVTSAWRRVAARMSSRISTCMRWRPYRTGRARASSMTSRNRRKRRRRRRFHKLFLAAVTDAAHGFDPQVARFTQLGAQTANVGIHSAGVSLELVTPHAVQQLLAGAGARPPALRHEVFQQPEFGSGQVHFALGHSGPVPGGVQVD